MTTAPPWPLRIGSLPWDPDQPITASQAEQRCLEVGVPVTANWRRVYMPEPISSEACVYLIQTPLKNGFAGLSFPFRVQFEDSALGRLYRRYQGWRIEYFGVEFRPTEDQPAPAVLAASPRIMLRNQQGEQLTHAAVYHAVAWKHGSAVAAEMRFGRWNQYSHDENWPLLERWVVSGFSRPPTSSEWSEARLGLALIQQVTHRGMTDEEALDEAVRLGKEWLAVHLDKAPTDFGRDQLATKKAVDRDTINKWLKRKHFNLNKVHRRLV